MIDSTNRVEDTGRTAIRLLMGIGKCTDCVNVMLVADLAAFIVTNVRPPIGEDVECDVSVLYI